MRKKKILKFLLSLPIIAGVFTGTTLLTSCSTIEKNKDDDKPDSSKDDSSSNKDDNSNPDTPNKPDGTNDPNLGDDSNDNSEKDDTDINPPSSFNYGNVPLPKVSDDKISDSDLIKMFNDVSSEHNPTKTYTFADRRIVSNKVGNSLFKWFTSEWIKYPYVWFDQQYWYFQNNKSLINNNEFVNLNANNHFVTTLSGGRYNEQWLYDTKYKNNFKLLISMALSTLQSGMTDVEKAFSIYKFVMSWFNYEIRYNKSAPENIYEHLGECGDYASLYAFLLNLAGIPAIPRISGGNRNNGKDSEVHEVVWMFLDPNNTNNPQWWLSDPTFGDPKTMVSNPNVTTGLTSTAGWYWKYYYFLLPTSKSQFIPLTDNGQHYTYNELFGTFWNEPYLSNTKYKASLLDNGDGFPLDKTMLANSNSNRPIVTSNWCYVNKYWYVVKREKNINKLYKYSFNSNKPIEFNLPKEINILTYDPYPQLYSYNNQLIFVNNNNNDVDKSFVFYNPDTNEILKEIKIPNSQKNLVTNYFVYNNHLYYTFDRQTYMEFKNYSFEQHYDVDTLKYLINYCIAISGTYEIGNKPNQVSSTIKNNFLSYLENVLKNDNYSDYKVIIDKVVSQLNNFEANINKSFILPIYKTSNIYEYTIEQLKNGWIDLRQLVDFFETPLQIINNSNLSLKYELLLNSNGIEEKYFSIITSDKSLVVTEDLIRKYDLDLNKSKFKIRVKSLDDNDFYETTPFKIVIDDANDIPNISNLIMKSDFNVGYRTNYDPSNVNWFERPLHISSKINNSKFVVKKEMLYLSFKTKKVTVTNLDSDNINLELGIPNEDNSGIYLIKIEYQIGHQKYSSYSNYFFAFRKEDINTYSQNTMKEYLNIFNTY